MVKRRHAYGYNIRIEGPAGLLRNTVLVNLAPTIAVVTQVF